MAPNSGGWSAQCAVQKIVCGAGKVGEVAQAEVPVLVQFSAQHGSGRATMSANSEAVQRAARGLRQAA